MSRIVDILLTDLRSLITDLGKDGGLISPSVYDTAQVLRLYPPQQGVWPAVEWLLGQQHADGGWGDPAAPLARDLPTLASVLALQTYGNRKATRDGAQAGLAFLRRQLSQWSQPLPDDLPIGVELLLPWLLDEATVLKLELPRSPYAPLVALGKQRQQMIVRMQPGTGTPAAHSWEAWGTNPDPALINNGAGGIGHSPAATAAWLNAAAGRTDLADVREAGQRYLEQAAAVTGEGIPGIVPTVWPINRFEQSFVLYILLITGLLEYPQLQNIVQTQVNNLAYALRPDGFGMSDFFIPDGDNTAAAIAVLCAAGHQVDTAILRQFENGDHFFAYPGELQPSLSVTARAVHALALSGEEVAGAQKFLIERQYPDGRWPGDKWHSSWLYTTLQVILALINSAHIGSLKSAVEAMLAYQYADGGWGNSKSTTTETVYGVLALRTLRNYGLLTRNSLDALRKAYQWLLRNYRPFNVSQEKYWIGKELYRPYRIDRAFELSTMLALALEEGSG